MKPFATTAIAKAFFHPDRDAILKYVELICNKESAVQEIVDLEDRKAAARTKAKWGGTEDKDLLKTIDDLIFHYLSYYQANHDFALLLSREELFVKFLRAIREPVDMADQDRAMKTTKIQGDINKLLEELLNGIKALRIQIYGGHQDMAAVKIKKLLTPESRLLKDKRLAGGSVVFQKAGEPGFSD